MVAENSPMRLALIVAVAANNVIGFENKLPWHLPQDLKYFKAKTLGKPIIMGRKTYESIGRPLPGRTNIVITRQRDWRIDEEVLIAHNLTDAFAMAESVAKRSESPCEEAFVIGGAEIYRNSLAFADRIYLTRINKEFTGDAYFPMLSDAEWLKVSAIEGEINACESHTFFIFDRIN